MAIDGAGRYVSGDYVDWWRLLRDSVGAFALLYVQIMTDGITRAGEAWVTTLSAVGGWLESVIFRTITLPAGGMAAAWQTAAKTLDALGVFGWLFAVVLSAVVIHLVTETMWLILSGGFDG